MGVKNKIFFPYEFIDSIEKLNYPTVPLHECFYSTLQKSNISAQDYDLVVRTWEREGWRTLNDLLIHYNQLDVRPFVQAVQKLLEPYLKDGIDIFKNSFSVSGAAKLKMLKAIEPDSFFCLFPKRHADLYKALRAQLTGGLSIVFSRVALPVKPKSGHIKSRTQKPVKKLLEKEKQHRSTSRSMITTPQECTGKHPRPVSSLLKGLIGRKNNEKTNLSNAETENKLANRHHA